MKMHWKQMDGNLGEKKHTSQMEWNQIPVSLQCMMRSSSEQIWSITES